MSASLPRSAPEGKLTRGGLLYEGNFSDWEPRMVAMLHKHGVRVHWMMLDGKVHAAVTFDHRRCKTSIKDLAAALCGTISPALLARIDMGQGITQPQHFANLLGTILVLTKPFAIMKLPAELRLRIYNIALSDRELPAPVRYQYNDGIFTIEIWTGDRTMSSKFHPLTRVSRQIRKEFLPLFFEQTKIQLLVGRRHVVFNPTHMRPVLSRAEIKAFELRMGMQSIKLLRRFGFNMGVFGTFDFTYNITTGKAELVSRRCEDTEAVVGVLGMCTARTGYPEIGGANLLVAARVPLRYPVDTFVEADTDDEE